MALELVFVCSRTINALRSGPLGELLDGYCDWLLASGYKRATVRSHLSNLSHLNVYLAGRVEHQGRFLSAEDVGGFFEKYSLHARGEGFSEFHVLRVQWSINRFTRYLRQQNLFEPAALAPYQPLLDAYLEWMRDYQHAAPGTLGIRSHCLARFLQWLGPGATPEGMQELTPETVEQFFLTYSQNMGHAGRRSMQAALRTCFRFCVYKGYVQQRLDHAVPTLRIYKLATGPELCKVYKHLTSVAPSAPALRIICLPEDGQK